VQNPSQGGRISVRFIPRHGMGKAPGRRNPRRARTPIAPEKSVGGRPNRLEEETPEARPSRSKAVARMLQAGPSMIRDTVDSAEMPLRQEAARRAARFAEGRYPRRCAPVAIRLVRLLPAERSANRTRGGTAERWAIPARSSSVGRTP